jgi:Family of unknown function (DUF5330)
MVNERLPDDCPRRFCGLRGAQKCVQTAETEPSEPFAQILDKFDFFELLENFALIRFDYGQKHLRAANGNFKPACYVWAQAAGVAAGDVRAMFFLLRLAFWLGVVLLLLPSGGGERGAAANNNVSASQAISAASATVGDLRGFCARQPDACNVGSQVATTLGYRAQAGAKMLYDVLSEALAPQEGATARGDATKQPAERSAIERASQSTLTPADLAPAWRGPPARKDSKHAA